MPGKASSWGLGEVGQARGEGRDEGGRGPARVREAVGLEGRGDQGGELGGPLAARVEAPGRAGLALESALDRGHSGAPRRMGVAPGRGRGARPGQERGH
ncbi:hypothetical protein PPSIR1_39315 [Plesiocystis pacifica SIR-1]|uniref:Uncharacterized protein n=1 Tax=Plesiocystis pacifica SIR-1 TaxID=391625 RepID=A6FXZ3_9BACT|nr:hypothetical protein PPSIR1_39315 [Plesiocystis pacifica SIR-1]